MIMTQGLTRAKGGDGTSVVVHVRRLFNFSWSRSWRAISMIVKLGHPHALWHIGLKVTVVDAQPRYTGTCGRTSALLLFVCTSARPALRLSPRLKHASSDQICLKTIIESSMKIPCVLIRLPLTEKKIQNYHNHYLKLLKTIHPR